MPGQAGGGWEDAGTGQGQPSLPQDPPTHAAVMQATRSWRGVGRRPRSSFLPGMTGPSAASAGHPQHRARPPSHSALGGPGLPRRLPATLPQAQPCCSRALCQGQPVPAAEAGGSTVGQKWPCQHSSTTCGGRSWWGPHSPSFLPLDENPAGEKIWGRKITC